MGTAGRQLEGLAVVVTGAGGGIGAALARRAAAEGARVVVNDLGVSTLGEGHSTTPAQTVVDEIVAAGGEAIANYDSVLDGDRIVQCALDNFGRIDIRADHTLVELPAKLPQEAWDALRGTRISGRLIELEREGAQRKPRQKGKR